MDIQLREKRCDFVPRPLTPLEAGALCEELKTTPNILGYTVKELLRFRETLVAEVDGAFAGVCLSKDLLFGWTDIAALYVLPAFRGQGVGTRLYEAAWRRAEARQRHILTLSRNPAVIGLMERSGMTMACSMALSPFALQVHMSWHMMSVYRLRESIRKSADLKAAPALRCGTKTFPPIITRLRVVTEPSAVTEP